MSGGIPSLALLAVLTAFTGSGKSSSPPPGKRGDAAKKAESQRPEGAKKEEGGPRGASTWELPAAVREEALLAVRDEVKEAGGVSVRVSVAPDGYRLLMARGIEEIRKANYGAKQLEEKLRALHARAKEYRGRVLVDLRITAGGGKEHHFFQGSVKDHLAAASSGKLFLTVLEDDPPARFAAWQVFEQPQGQKRRIYKKSLAPLKTSRLQASFKPLKEGDRSPISFTVRGLVKVTDNLEAQRKDYRIFESLNIEKKQISTTDWQGLVIPEIAFTFYPGQWQVAPLPPEFEAFLERLAKPEK